MHNFLCQSCKSQDFSSWIVKKSVLDNREYPIMRCNKCKSAFVMPRPIQEYLDKHYSSSETSQAGELKGLSVQQALNKIMNNEKNHPNSSIDARRMVHNAKSLTNGRQFLDIGAGYGFFSSAALIEGFEVTAIEPTLMCRDIFQEMNSFKPISGMLNAEFTHANLNKFDVILLSQVLEHVNDLDSILNQLNQLITSDGVVVIAVPHFQSLLSKIQGKNDMFIDPPEHLNFFTMTGLLSLFAQHGFTCYKAETISRIDTNKIARQIKLPIVNKLFATLILYLLRLSDRFKTGMFINAYFKKTA